MTEQTTVLMAAVAFLSFISGVLSMLILWGPRLRHVERLIRKLEEDRLVRKLNQEDKE